MPQHSRDEIARRRATITRLHLQGKTHRQIAEVVGVSRQQVGLDLTEIRKEWHESTLHDFNQAKVQELAKIDHLEATAWQSFFESAKPANKAGKRLRGEVAGRANPKLLETFEEVEDRLPDPRYLMIVLHCIDLRCDLLGLDAPFKLTSLNNSPVLVEDSSRLSTDQLRARIAELRQVIYD